MPDDPEVNVPDELPRFALGKSSHALIESLRNIGLVAGTPGRVPRAVFDEVCKHYFAAPVHRVLRDHERGRWLHVQGSEIIIADRRLPLRANLPGELMNGPLSATKERELAAQARPQD
jgi:hypothetical protein